MKEKAQEKLNNSWVKYKKSHYDAQYSEFVKRWHETHDENGNGILPKERKKKQDASGKADQTRQVQETQSVNKAQQKTEPVVNNRQDSQPAQTTQPADSAKVVQPSRPKQTKKAALANVRQMMPQDRQTKAVKEKAKKIAKNYANKNQALAAEIKAASPAVGKGSSTTMVKEFPKVLVEYIKRQIPMEIVSEIGNVSARDLVAGYILAQARNTYKDDSAITEKARAIAKTINRTDMPTETYTLLRQTKSMLNDTSSSVYQLLMLLSYLINSSRFGINTNENVVNLRDMENLSLDSDFTQELMKVSRTKSDAMRRDQLNRMGSNQVD